MPSLNVMTSLVDEVLEMSQFPLSIRDPDLVFLFNFLDPMAIITKKYLVLLKTKLVTTLDDKPDS